MTATTPPVPDEETPLLGGKQGPAIKRTTEREPETAVLAGPSNHTSLTPSIRGRTNADGGSDVVKKTPLPWAQFSIVLLLMLTEPLTSQVISPVSSSAVFFLIFCFGTILHRPKGFD